MPEKHNIFHSSSQTTQTTSSTALALAVLIGAIGGASLTHLFHTLRKRNDNNALQPSVTDVLQSQLSDDENNASSLPLNQALDYTADQLPSRNRKLHPIRIYVDGCFDLFHVGHSNALRQAKACGDHLVVGLVSDSEILLNKGSEPVMNEEERYAALSACKWVDEIIRNVPYDLSVEWVDGLLKDYKIDYIAHGDDPCITKDGKDAYAYAKSIGVYKEFKRTEGASTTDIVGRMLLMTKEHHVHDSLSELLHEGIVRSSSLSLEGSGSDPQQTHNSTVVNDNDVIAQRLLSCLPQSHTLFLPTARRISQFSEGKVPRPQDKVVYVCGAWDLFNSGHISALIEARKMGDFLLVGIHDDATVNMLRGNGLPILNLYERTLSLLSCKYVDEVIIGAPFVITDELIKSMNISIVAKGTVSDIANSNGHSSMSLGFNQGNVESLFAKEYAVPFSRGILREFTSKSSLTALSVIERILAQRNAFQMRYDKKSKAEEDYIQTKGFVEEM
jgi:ethanolamine-phosphate cytidylyltransferase